MKNSKIAIAASMLVFFTLAISVINGVQAIGVVTTINVQQEPSGLAYDSAKGEVFVVNTNAGTVSVISDSDNTVVATSPLGNPVPIGVASWIVYDSGKDELFVSLSFGSNGRVVVISDTNNTVVDQILVGGEPEGLAYDSAKGEIYVANALSDNVSVISDVTDTVVANATVPGGTLAIAYDSVQGELFVTSASNTISVISDNSNTVVKNIKVGIDPQNLAYDSGTKQIFVSNLNSKTISVISDKSNTVVKTLPIDGYPYAITYDSGKNELLVAISDETGLSNPFTTVNTISIISDSNYSLIAKLTVGGSGQAYDSAKGEVFVANALTGTVSVISDASDSSASPSPTVPEFSVEAFILVMLITGIIVATFARLKSASKHLEDV